MRAVTELTARKEKKMNQNKAAISLELLLLNDLLRVNAIDKDIYDKAVQMITSIKEQAQPASQ